MRYTEVLDRLRRTGDMGAVLAFLEAIFRAPENQKVCDKASDDRHPDEAQSRPTPAQIFEAIVASFTPAPLETKLDVVFDYYGLGSDEALGEYAEMQRFHPFNCVRFVISDYERCDALIDTGHYDPEADELIPGFGLNHDIVTEEESTEEYDVVYDLLHEDHYQLVFDGEVLDNRHLYHDLKATLFSVHLLELVEALFADERFARHPKAFPFHIQFESRSYNDNAFFYAAAPYTEAGLDRLATAALHRDSRVERGVHGPEERFAYFVRFIAAPESSAYGVLLALCREERACFDRLLALGLEVLERETFDAVGVLAQTLWQLVDVDAAAVVSFQRAVLARPVPELRVADPDRAQTAGRWLARSPVEAALRLAGAQAAMLETCRAAVPAAYHDVLATDFDAAWRRLLEHPEPAVRLIARDALCPADARIEHDSDLAFPSRVDADYVADAIALLDRMPARFTGYGDAWDFVMARLEHLGERAVEAAPKLVALLERYVADRFDEQLANTIGRVLFALGVEEVPEAVHRAQSAYYQEDYYREWIARGPNRAWQAGGRSDDELAAMLPDAEWPVAHAIVEHLVARGARHHAAALVAAFERFADDDDRRRMLARVLWPFAPDGLARSERFQAYVPRFLRDYPGGLRALTREVLTRLEGAGQQAAIVRIAPELPAQATIACFKSVLQAHFATGRYTEAEALCATLASGLDEMVPDWVLIQSNRAVVLMHAGQPERAEAVFDEIFSKDYSRFEPPEADDEGDDDGFDALPGGPRVDDQLVFAFQTYYAMARFNRACLYALTDRPDRAVATLAEAVSRGHYTAERVMAEGDFASLHGREDFQRLVRTLDGAGR